jgi:hypothetical protein
MRQLRAVLARIAGFFAGAPAGAGGARRDRRTEHVPTNVLGGPQRRRRADGTGRACFAVRPKELRLAFDGSGCLSDRERFALLAARGAVDPQVVERWQRLRPVSAHGNREGQGEEEELFPECMAVVGLLYQMVAHLIDYRGQLTNFAEPGWPLRPYPRLPAADPGNHVPG